MNNHLLLNALNYYDKIVILSKDYHLIMSNDNKKKFNERYILQSKDKNIFNKYEIDIIGTYLIDQNIWIWGWLNFETKLFNIVEWCYKSIENNNIYNSSIKSIILNSKTIISDDIQLDILLSIACYLYKSNLILKYNISKNIIYYFSIKYI